MSRLNPKTLMWLFGVAAIGGLALFIALYQSSPGPLASPHAQAIPGNMIWSCKKCHAEEGMNAGCLSCHAEIAGQLDSDTGIHAYLRNEKTDACETCHAEHHGGDFQLINALSWEGIDTNRFDHPQVDFKLTGKHDKLACGKCHDEKLQKPFTLADFPDQPREHTMLGLNQECISCHRDVHESGEKTRDCTQCHNQDAFKPAPGFDHSKYYVLEGPHAKASCASCHQQDVEAPLGKFGPVKGKQCVDCHASPHRFEQALHKDCQSCHLGADETWTMGQRGIDAPKHEKFGFNLEGAHMTVECAKCHRPELETYADRFPDPDSPDYNRGNDQCSGCHADPHKGQFEGRYTSCAQCHVVQRFRPSTLGPAEHPDSYPLKGGHQAVACIQCHKMGEGDVRQFKGTATACRDCHANPHGAQFDKEIAQNDCTACHLSDFSTFRIREYKHQDQRAFFLGKGHARASCIQCHVQPAEEDAILNYRKTPSTCASCHADIHRGQFRQLGTTACERCHGSVDQWTADRFDHEQDSTFALGKAHSKVECRACHQPVPQLDGESVVQYRPLTTKCEDCHGFQKQ